MKGIIHENVFCQILVLQKKCLSVSKVFLMPFLYCGAKLKIHSDKCCCYYFYPHDQLVNQNFSINDAFFLVSNKSVLIHFA